MLFLILQRYDFSSKSQLEVDGRDWTVVLFLILQRYDFSSKSQQATSGVCYTVRCFLYCKDTIFRANHNLTCLTLQSLPVVSYIAKIRFFEQITTQLFSFPRLTSCFLYCKDTIFRANHNRVESGVLSVELFLILQRYDFSSKSQRPMPTLKQARCCFLYCKFR